MRTNLLFILFIFCTSSLFAQIGRPGTPASERFEVNKKIKKYIMPSFNLMQLLQEDEEEEKMGGLPPRFGHKMDVKISPKEYGTWEALPDGGRLWRLEITSFGASSINLLFEHFYMPLGAEMYIYNKDKSYQIGAFTMLNNKDDGQFATAPVKGESIILEYYEPAHSIRKGKILISHVVHAYKDFFSTGVVRGYGDSGNCNNDVACAVSAGWEDEITSTCLIIVGGTRNCTGTMVNNTSGTDIPYILSANHCGTNVNNSWVFVFNYDSPTCNGADGSTAQSIAGGTLRSSLGASDFALMEMSASPPPDYAVFYSGWDKSGVAASTSVGIHHPSGDVKKISFNTDALYDGDWPGDANVPGGDHWIVDNWEDGTTEGGSSGSSLYDGDKRLVGQLHGGGAACGNTQYDSYGKFSVSWTGGGSNNNRLSNWLDPNNTNQDQLDGTYYIPASLAFNMTASGIILADESCSTDVAPEIEVKNIGNTDITSFDFVYSYDGGATQTFTYNGPTIGFFQSTTFTLPTQTLPIGNHTISGNLTNLNGSNVDEDLSDNMISKTFDLINGSVVTVDLLTDNYSEETSFTIEDDMGNVLYTESTFAQDATLYTLDYCLADGCYVFTIFDTYSDGICCGFGEGSYTISDDSGTLTTGGDFGASESFNFCVSNSAGPLNADFSTDAVYCEGESFSPNNLSTGATTYTWSTPGASTASQTGANPSISYPTAGTYIITLDVSDGMGGTDMTTASVTIAPNPSISSITGNTSTVNEAIESYSVTDNSGSSYVWTVTNGTVVSGSGTANVTVQWNNSSSTGEICVTETSSNDCVGNNYCENVDLSPLSTENIENGVGLKVFPNPTNGLIHVDMNRFPEQIEIYDVVGKRLYNNDQPGIYNAINMPSINGIYLLKITFKEGAISRKIVVNK